MIELAQQALQYIVLTEPFASSTLIAPVILAMQNLVRCMMNEQDTEEVISHRGRPRIKIYDNQLVCLLECGFKIQDIATCSRRTIERRMQDLSITVHDFSSMSDAELDERVGNIISIHPQCGVKTVLGQLRSQGYKVQRQRVRDSLQRIDPSGVHARARRVLHRRVYNVKGPNSLWHLDGYHKLIRWNIVIHGGIDGFSRLIVYLRVSSNNYAATVLSAFTAAIDEYGLPSSKN